MKTKRELQIEAKRLIDDALPTEAMNVCKDIWSSFPKNSQDEFNLYDAQLVLKATINLIGLTLKKFQNIHVLLSMDH